MQQEYFDKFCTDVHSLDLDTLCKVRDTIISVISERKEARLAAFRIKQEELSREAEELGFKTPSVYKTRTTGDPKFRNPTNPKQTWTGRGKTPAWLKSMLDQGAEIENFLIS